MYHVENYLCVKLSVWVVALVHWTNYNLITKEEHFQRHSNNVLYSPAQPTCRTWYGLSLTGEGMMEEER